MDGALTAALGRWSEEGGFLWQAKVLSLHSIVLILASMCVS